MHAYTKTMAIGALAPFALALGVNVAVALSGQLAPGWDAFLGAASALAAALCWFAPALARHGPPPPEKDEMTPTKDRITELLTETRIILPGVQALLGFQFAAYLMGGFEKLPPSAKAVNTASLLLLVAAMILLMMPAPYHRLAEHGENTERFERVAAFLILTALVPLALGVAGDVYVVVTAVWHGTGLAAGIAGFCAFLMAAVWFGVPLAARLRAGEDIPGRRSGRT
jgi:MFS family permease